jgi:hypothetical protein
VAKRVVRRKNAAVTCPYCSATCCCGCVQVYMLGSFQDPHCPGCKRAWNDEFLDANLSRTFRTGPLTKHRQATWLERQRALLPGRQHLLEAARQQRDARALVQERAAAVEALGLRLYARRLRGSSVDFTLSRMRNAAAGIVPPPPLLGMVVCADRACTPGGSGSCTKCGHWTCPACSMSTTSTYVGPAHVCEAPVPQLEALRAAARAEEGAAEREYAEARRQLEVAQNELRMAMYAQDNQRPRERAAPAAFVRACPFDACRGFLSTAWKCGTCARWACPDCHEPKGLERDDKSHVCKPENLASAQLLRKETRPCPSCGSAIFKIAGCDQMWCTACNTGFDWKSGQRIQEGRIHNPHFFEYMRNNMGGGAAAAGGAAGGAAAAGGCGGQQGMMPHTDQLASMCVRLPWEVRNALFMAHGRCAHIREVPRARLARLVGRDAEAEQEQLSVAFLLNDISETEWMQRLQRGEKRRRKYQAFLDILDSYVQACTDVFAMLMSRSLMRCLEPEAQTAVRHEEALMGMAREAMQGVCRVYQCKMPHGITYP